MIKVQILSLIDISMNVKQDNLHRWFNLKIQNLKGNKNKKSTKLEVVSHLNLILESTNIKIINKNK